jgi:hypothetical protein
MSRTERAVDRSVEMVADPVIGSMAPVPPLLMCPDCNVEMRLLGIEPDEDDRDLRDIYTFECTKCTRLEVRSVRLK